MARYSIFLEPSPGKTLASARRMAKDALKLMGSACWSVESRYLGPTKGTGQKG